MFTLLRIFHFWYDKVEIGRRLIKNEQSFYIDWHVKFDSQEETFCFPVDVAGTKLVLPQRCDSRQQVIWAVNDLGSHCALMLRLYTDGENLIGHLNTMATLSDVG